MSRFEGELVVRTFQISSFIAFFCGECASEMFSMESIFLTQKSVIYLYIKKEEEDGNAEEKISKKSKRSL